MQPKSGYKTTEFWVTLGVMAAAGFGIPVDPETAMVVIGSIGGAYVAIRGWVKAMMK